MIITTTSSENFGNLRSQYFNKSDDSDLLLQINELGTSIKRLEIHAHSLVVKSGSRYIASCLSSGLNHQNRSVVSCGGQTPFSRNKIVLRLELDFSNGLSDRVVEFFFSLFYLNRFDHCDDSDVENQQIKEELHYNILELYELACYFFFDALTVYIEEHLFSTMSLSYFTPLYRFCLTFDEARNRYSIIESKAALFTRLLQWYQACVDTSIQLLPPSSSAIEAVCDSDYYAVHKASIIADVWRRVNMIEKCELPSREILRGVENTELRYYHRICPTCLDSTDKKANRIGAFYYADLGQLRKTTRNGSETYFFRLKKKKKLSYATTTRQGDNNNLVTIELTRRRAYKSNTIDTQLEEEHAKERRYLCKSRVSLLSRKREIDRLEYSYNQKDISVPTEIGKFTPHKAKYCYDGQCDQCNKSSSIYIVILQISLTKQVCQSTSSILEEMGMQVDEATSYI